jgi:hypothetical protein
MLLTLPAFAKGHKTLISESENAPFLFIENKGQVFNEYNLPANDVLFVVKQNNVTVFVYHNGLSYQFTQLHENKNNNLPEALTELAKDFPLGEQAISTFRFDVRFEQANTNVNVMPSLQNKYIEHYFGGDYAQPITNIRSFEKITIQNIYNGIDWVLYQQNGKLKYDFIVHPNANPSQIKMLVDAADEVMLLNDHHLQFQTKLGAVNDAGLLCTEKETNADISAAFKLTGNTITFDIDNYNTENTLIIDPAVDWSTYYGGFGEDAVNGMTVDQVGDVLITGYTSSSNNMAYLGYENAYLGGFFDVYVAKLDADGSRIWGTYFGGNKGDYGTEVAVNSLNEIYVTGFTFSANFETTPGAHQEALGNNYDAFLFKLTTEGDLIWSTLYGGGSYDYARGLAIDTSDNIYISGSTSSSAAIASGGWQNTKGAGDDEFLAKFNGEGVRLWATYMGGEAGDYSRAVGADSENNVYLVGYTESTTGIAYNGFDEVWSGNYDCTLTKYDAAGNMLWSTYFGGNGEDNANGIDFDINDNVFVAIQTGTNNGLALNGYRGTSGGSVDAMLAKFNPDGDRLWSTYYGGTGEDMGKAVTVSGEFVYLCGHTASATDIAMFGYQNTLGGLRDALLAKFDVMGNFYWATYAGGFWDEYGRTIDVLDDENIVIGGKSFSWDFHTTVGAHQKFYGGGPADGFVQRIYDCASGEIYYTDADGDGYGISSGAMLSCEPIEGRVLNATDCDDANNLIFPGATEICNTIDDDCGGDIDEDVVNANVTAAGPTTFCQGSNVVLETISGIDYTYQWRKNGVDIVGANSVTYVATTSGNYTVLTTITGGCDSLSNAIVVTANKKPKPAITAIGSLDICATGTVTLKTTNKPGNTYQWYKDGAIIPGAITNLYTATAVGNYYVRETAATGCFKNASSVVVTTSCKEAGNEMMEDHITIIPNPNNGQFLLQLTNLDVVTDNMFIHIYNAAGQLIYKGENQSNNHVLNINIQLPEGISNGIYIVQLIAGNQSWQQQFVVE